MIYTKYLVTAVILNLTLVSFAVSKGQEVSEILPYELYKIAQKKLGEGNFRDAITKLEVLDKLYPFGPYAQQVQLDLIYAYYRNANLPMVQTIIARFMRLNPTHSNIDYILYMKGLTNMALDGSILQRFFSIDRSDCNPEYATIAFNDFSQILRKYPDSLYTTDAHRRLLLLKNRLAKYELSVAKFYTRRKAYVAVINRIEQMLKNYPDTQATRVALPLLENAYRKLQLFSAADKVAKIINTN